MHYIKGRLLFNSSAKAGISELEKGKARGTSGRRAVLA